MRKKLALLLIVVMVFGVMLVGCGSDDDYEDEDMAYEEEVISVAGTEWLLVSMTDQEGEEIPAEDVELTFGELIYEFTEDGILIAHISISDAQTESTWTQDGDRIDVVTGDVESFYTLDGNIMFTESEGAKLVFELQ